MYSLYHTNVDGGGHIATYGDLATAKREADRHAAISHSNGNPYGYIYYVRFNGRTLYQTQVDPLTVREIDHLLWS